MDVYITPVLKQAWCASAILISITAQGMTLGFTSILFHALQEPESLIKTDIHSVSWLASSLGPSALTGITFACVLMDWCGRRNAILICMVPGIIGWILTFLAQNYTMLLMGQIMAAATGGGINAVGVVMLGEYTSPKHRGMFLTLKTTGVSLGSMIVHLLDKFLKWNTIAVIILIPNIIAFFIAYTWPESPTWSALRNQFEKTERDFLWLRGNDEKSMNELNELIKAQKERLSNIPKKISFGRKLKNHLNKFTMRNFLLPLAVGSIACIVMETGGRHYFAAYALQIVGNATNTKTIPHYYTLSVEIIIIISSTFSSILVRIMRRRTLLFSTGLASLVILTIMCFYLYSTSNGYISNDRPWIIISLLIVYFSFTNLGCAPIPITLQGEIFPVAHRELGSVILGTVMCFGLMVFLKITPYLLVTLKIYGMFGVYGIITAAMLLVLYFILPETKDRTLQEIENYFTYGKFKREENDDEDVNLKMIVE